MQVERLIYITMRQDRRHRINVIRSRPRRAASNIKRNETRLQCRCRHALLDESKTFIRVFLAIGIRHRQERAMERLRTTDSRILHGIRNYTFMIIARNILSITCKGLIIKFCMRERQFLTIALGMEGMELSN